MAFANFTPFDWKDDPDHSTALNDTNITAEYQRVGDYALAQAQEALAQANTYTNNHMGGGVLGNPNIISVSTSPTFLLANQADKTYPLNIIHLTGANPITITIPPGANTSITAGSCYFITAKGSGVFQFDTADGTATLNTPFGFKKITPQYGQAFLYRENVANPSIWFLSGNLGA